MNAIVLEEMTV